MNVYLTKVIDFEYNNFNEQSEEFNKSSIKSKIILKIIFLWLMMII